MIAAAVKDARETARTFCRSDSSGRTVRLDRGALDTAFHTDSVRLFDIVKDAAAALMLRQPQFVWGRSKTHEFRSNLQAITRRAKFRGLFAPASLKRAPDFDELPFARSVSIIPGPVRPGLIEASASMSMPTIRTRIPGPVRPGLIEASDAGTICASSSREFRGLFAPASLKRRKRQSVTMEQGWRNPIPGPVRPGLIEAGYIAPTTSSASMGAEFRGLFAPASLKQP